MIPLRYGLRQGVRVEQAAGSWRVVSELPLCVMNLNAAAAHLLTLTRTPLTVAELATALAMPAERLLRLCERFRSRGLLDVLPPSSLPPSEVPSVSVIIPCKDREAELQACLLSLQRLDYPAEKLEFIVVDDGSRDGTAAVARSYGCVVLRNERNRGQSYSRNLAAAHASGEILAFIDSDCVAETGWLGDLVPFFSWRELAACGGQVAGHEETSSLDRYEMRMSSLSLGSRLIVAGDDPGTFYMPTCNLLVRREAYLNVGGLREDLRVGEDVDLCWRLRKAGSFLVYSPAGRVEHRHRAGLAAMLRRRAEYGTSEALLHDLHRDKRKRFALPLPALLTLGAVLAGLLAHPAFLPLAFVPPACEAARKIIRLTRERAAVRHRSVCFAVLRSQLSFLYFTAFHLVRYYLLALLAGGMIVHRLWLVGAVALLYAAYVDFSVRKPRLNFAAFLFYYTAEHAAYQVGVFAGCVRRRSFRSYLLSFRSGVVRPRPAQPAGRAGAVT